MILFKWEEVFGKFIIIVDVVERVMVRRFFKDYGSEFRIGGRDL